MLPFWDIKNIIIVDIMTFLLAFAGFFYALLEVSTEIIFIVFTGFLFFFALPLINTSLNVMYLL
jgi:hypothetical protein